jgi:competence protein ComEC
MSFRNFAHLAAILLLSAALSCAGEKGKLTVTWLDLPVHGLAAVMETPSGKVFLIDTGGVQQKDDSDYNAGRDTIAPFLTTRGHTEIAGISVSHPHADHYGGAMWLIGNWKVGQFVDNGYEGRGQTATYTRLRPLAQQRGGTYRAVHGGDKLDWDEALSVEVLSPPAEFLSTQTDPAKISEHGLLNSNSIVLRVQHGKNVFVFPGDSYGGAFEQHLREKVAPEKMKTTVLTAPHHGFNPGIAFPAMTSPRFVVASCLADYPSNASTPYPRSPGDRAIEVFGKLGAKVFVTAFQGNVQAVSDGETVKMTTQRERAPAP